MKCPFPIIPKTKTEREDYAMIEESVLENERKGNCFIRVYPNEEHLHRYRNFFEEERRNDNILHNYVFFHKYKNMQIDLNFWMHALCPTFYIIKILFTLQY